MRTRRTSPRSREWLAGPRRPAAARRRQGGRRRSRRGGWRRRSAATEPEGQQSNTRPLEQGVVTDLERPADLRRVPAARPPARRQQPRQRPARTTTSCCSSSSTRPSELWLKLMIHELRGARSARSPPTTCGRRSRAWRASSRSSAAHRAVVGAGDADPDASTWSSATSLGTVVGLPVVPVPRGRVPARQQERRDAARSSRTTRRRTRCSPSALEAPSVYDEFLRYLARRGHAVPDALLRARRDRSRTGRPRRAGAGVPRIYEDADAHWEAYETCEELVDLEENFQLWRFRHLRTVERIIGFKRGTGGSAGVGFLRKGAGPDVLPGAVRRPDRDREWRRVTDDLLARAAGAGRRRPARRLPRPVPRRPTASSRPTWTATRWAGRCAATAERLDAFVREQWGGPADPRLDRRLAGVAADGSATGSARSALGAGAGPDRRRRLHDGAALQAGAGRGRRPRPAAREVVLDTDNFPTDRYVLEGIAAERGLELVWIETDPAAGVTPAQVADGGRRRHRAGAVQPRRVPVRAGSPTPPEITGSRTRPGALVLWDLCHSVGSVPVELDDVGRRPGGRLHLQVPQRRAGRARPSPTCAASHQDELRQPIQGWMGRRGVVRDGPRLRAGRRRPRAAQRHPADPRRWCRCSANLDMLDEAGHRRRCAPSRCC